LRRQVTVSKALNRRLEETLGFDIQVEKTTFKETSQLCPYGGLANTADASEEYAHAAMLDECRAIPSRPAIIDDSCRAVAELSTNAAHTGRAEGG
jgi:hypothetical protein